MKSVTEFLNFKLAEGLKVRTALTAEGKSPEEIAAAMGEKFKLEGDKLKYFVNAVEVASKTTEKLFRINVVKLNEGQNPPHRGTLIEEFCYIAEVEKAAADIKKADTKAADGGRGGQRGKHGGKGGGKPKGSPWGPAPEEIEAKKAAARQAAREKSLAGKGS